VVLFVCDEHFGRRYLLISTFECRELRLNHSLLVIAGMEAVWKIDVENFPAFIVVDDKGEDFFQEWLG
jgi:Fumarase C-terminus